MKLQDLPRLLPGADVRIKLRRRLCFVTLRHEGRVGHGIHKKLTFATRNAAMALQPAERS
jgi:hypothetical protein